MLIDIIKHMKVKGERHIEGIDWSQYSNETMEKILKTLDTEANTKTKED